MPQTFGGNVLGLVSLRIKREILCGILYKNVHNRDHMDRFAELIIGLQRLYPKCFRSLSHGKFKGKFKSI